MKYWKLALMCRIAYKSNKKIKARLLQNGLNLSNITIIEQGPLKCYVATIDDVQYIVFKGTDDWREVLIDLNLLPKKILGGSAHSGVYKSAIMLYNKLYKVVDFGKKTIFTGHSLGAGLAFFMIDLFSIYGHTNLAGAIGFGVPNIADNEYKRHWANEQYKKIKIQNNLDLIGNSPKIFEDISDELIYINRNDKLKINPPKSYLIKDKLCCYLTFRFRELYKDHRSQEYYEKLQKLDI